jgi:hypothetical protein
MWLVNGGCCTLWANHDNFRHQTVRRFMDAQPQLPTAEVEGPRTSVSPGKLVRYLTHTIYGMARAMRSGIFTIFVRRVLRNCRRRSATESA